MDTHKWSLTSKSNVTIGLRTYTGDLGFIQAVSLITVAGVTISCVVTNPWATNVRVYLALIHLWAKGHTKRESINTTALSELIMGLTKYYEHQQGSIIHY